MSESQCQKRIFKGQISVGELRYSRVIKLIQEKQIRKLIDFGCCECHLLKRIQKFEIVRHMVGVDIDERVFLNEDLKPFNIKRLERKVDQVLELYHGSALEQYPQLKKFSPDLVSLVELIEHIDEKDHFKLNENVFSYIRPKYVFISTPNVEFNVAFGWGDVKSFRHHDHRFEWTRKQFQQYVDGVCEKYGYKASISGVGEALQEEYEKNGYCSQIAIFERQDSKHFSSPKQKYSNQTESPSTLSSPVQQTVSIPLTLKHTHTNHNWKSISTQILHEEIEMIISICEPTKVLPWHKIISELKSTAIVKKLAKQVDDIWCYDFMLKGTIVQFLKGKEDVIKVMDEGITRVRQKEKEKCAEMREEQESIDHHYRGVFEMEDLAEYLMSRSEIDGQSEYSVNIQEPETPENYRPFDKSIKLYNLRKRKAKQKQSTRQQSRKSRSSKSPHQSQSSNSNSWSISPPILHKQSSQIEKQIQQSMINY